MDSAEATLRTLGIQLPDPPKALASYVPVQQVGELLYTSGVIPVWNGEIRYRDGRRRPELARRRPGRRDVRPQHHQPGPAARRLPGPGRAVRSAERLRPVGARL